jgi:hypothetical protein
MGQGICWDTNHNVPTHCPLWTAEFYIANMPPTQTGVSQEDGR